MQRHFPLPPPAQASVSLLLIKTSVEVKPMKHNGDTKKNAQLRKSQCKFIHFVLEIIWHLKLLKGWIFEASDHLIR